MAEIKRSDGLTESERALKYLCEKSFFSFFSYPNLTKDQGRKNGRGHGQELIDLLVVFGSDILLFSDKSCGFTNSGHIQTDWKRWYKGSITESLRQLYRAERWIKEQPKLIFLDRACTRKFPFNFPEAGKLRFHRIIIARGAAERCRQEFGGSGSLIINPFMEVDSLENTPFCIGPIGNSKGFVHVFDEVSLNIIMSELDTIVDFIRYLREKEDFIEAGKLGFSAGEQELLALYLSSRLREEVHFVTTNDVKLIENSNLITYKPRATTSASNSTISNNDDFLFPEVADDAFVLASEGLWDSLCSSIEYKKYKERNKISKKWDRFIEMIGNLILQDRLVELPNFQHSFSSNERNARLLASLSRIERRDLSEIITDLLAKSPKDKTSFRAAILPRTASIAYLFLLVPSTGNKSYEEYRQSRSLLLMTYCMIFKAHSPHFQYVIGIASEAPGMRGASEEIFSIDAKEWTSELNKEALEVQKLTGILNHFDWNRLRVDSTPSDNEEA